MNKTKILYINNIHIKVSNLFVAERFGSQSESICISAYSKATDKGQSNFDANFFLELDRECRSVRSDYYEVKNIERLFYYIADISDNAKCVLSSCPEKMEKSNINKCIEELKQIYADLYKASVIEIADLLKELIWYLELIITQIDLYRKKEL